MPSMPAFLRAGSDLPHSGLTRRRSPRRSLGITGEEVRQAGYHRGNGPRPAAACRDQPRQRIFALDRGRRRALRTCRAPPHLAHDPALLRQGSSRLSPRRNPLWREVPDHARPRSPSTSPTSKRRDRPWPAATSRGQPRQCRTGNRAATGAATSRDEPRPAAADRGRDRIRRRAMSRAWKGRTNFSAARSR